jgi:hypothetical protein
MRASVETLIDISIDKGDSTKAYAYLDGPDARLFQKLRARIGSDESVQAAIILQGLISKLERSGQRDRAEEIKELLPQIVGLSYTELETIALTV